MIKPNDNIGNGAELTNAGPRRRGELAWLGGPQRLP